MKMKWLLAALLLPPVAFAQTKEGRVVYERTMRMGNNLQRPNGANVSLPPEVQAQLEAQLAKPRIDQFELLFTPQQSLYQYLPSAAEDGGPQTISGGGVTIQMRGGGATDVSHVNLETGIRTDQRDVMDREFVVTDTVRKLQWKLSEETKPVLNFTARKATARSVVNRPRVTMENGEMKRETFTDTVQVVAWYTTDVPVPAGPNYAGQLPGLILELDVNNGQNVTTAVAFSPKVSAAKIKAPSSGKKLTAAEFEKEQAKLMEEMRRNMNAGGERIRIQQ